MPRVKNRSSEDIRERLLAAARRAATDAIQNVDSTEPVVSVEVKSVVASVNRDLDEEGIPRITTGFVNFAFGGKQEFLQQALDALIAPEMVQAQQVTKVARDRLAAGDSPQVVRTFIVHADLSGILTTQGESRVYFAHHAYSARPSVRDSLATVYREFDWLYIPLYEDELRSRGRQLSGITVQELAKIMTALVEGFALRCLGDRGQQDQDVAAIVGTATEPGLAASASEALMDALTVRSRAKSGS